MSPALLRYVWKMGYSPLCLAADIVELGVRGLLRIEREKSLFKQTWVLHRSGLEPPAELPPGQRAPLEGLLPRGSARLALEQRHHAVIGAARGQHLAALRRAAEPRYFVGNGGTVAVGIGLSVLVVLLAFEHAQTDAGAVIAFLVLLLLIFVNLLFLHLMRQPTAEGRALLDRIEGLRQYLGVAERDELRGLPAPDGPEPALDADRYQALLPYALALEVEQAWTGRFVAAVGAAAAAQTAQRMGWYSGGSMSNLGEVSSALGSSLGSAISASASPPGSSSGSGGGGSSGGGGGGGGGGGR
jgi:hypothetical protein